VRLPHSRFTVRCLMTLVAMVAIAMFGGMLADKSIGTSYISNCDFSGVPRPKNIPATTIHFVPAIGWMFRAVTLGYLVAAWVVVEIGKKKRLRSLESKSGSTYWF
jgi:hypothetical protein